MNYLSIEEDGSWIFIARINKKRYSLDIHLLKSIKKGQNVKRFYIPRMKIVSALTPGEASIKSFENKVRRKNAIKKTVDFSMSDLSKQLKIKLFYNYLIPKPSLNPIHAVYTSKDMLKNHLSKMQLLGLDPHFVTYTPMALVKFTNLISPSTKNCLIVHLGKSRIFLVHMHDNIPSQSWKLEIGLSSFYDSFSKDVGSDNLEELANKTDLLKINRKERPNFSLFIEAFRKKFSLGLDSFSIDSKIPLLLTGKLTEFMNLDKFFLDLTKTYTETSINNTPKQASMPQITEYATCIGAVLDASSKDKRSIQFRQNELQSSFFLRSFLGRLSLSALAILLLSTVLIFSSIYYSSLKKDQFNDLFFKMVHEDERILNVEDPSRFTVEDLHQNIKRWKKYLVYQGKRYPFIPNVPNVSETLVYLSKIQSHGIKLKDLHYELEKYPSLQNQKHLYLAKVSIDFTTDSPTSAKEFYSELEKQKKWIDLSKKISYEKKGNIYTSSFYLKQKYKQ